MADPDEMSEVNATVYSGDEELMEDVGSNEDWEGWPFDPEIVLEKMLYVARRMSPKVLKEQKYFLSLATRAIEEAETEAKVRAKSGAEREKKGLQAPPLKMTTSKENGTENLGLLSPASSRASRKLSPEDLEFVKELKAKGVGWEDIAKRHFPGRTWNSVKGSYYYWLKKNEDIAEKEQEGNGGKDGVDEHKPESTSVGHDLLGQTSQEMSDEEDVRALPILSAFELKRRANIAENQALLDGIARIPVTPRRLAREKRKISATPSTPTCPIRRSERNIRPRRIV